MTDPPLRGEKFEFRPRTSVEQWLEILNPDFSISFKMFQIKHFDYYPFTMFIKRVTIICNKKMVENDELNKLKNGDFCKYLEELYSITSASI